MVMPFVTLCVTQRFCDISWIGVRLRFSFPRSSVGMQFVTLCVTRRFCDIRRIGVRLRFSFPRSAW
ncbi:hypothetical protein CXB36_20145 [Pseudomonas syringae pv. syringae]|nr:hypothetical protein BKC06_008480 [Pseudomonas syringae pv. syringae]POP62905.1 hypothetical protein CXB36_20145 [Pseudomonas syringae pv. syringae]